MTTEKLRETPDRDEYTAAERETMSDRELLLLLHRRLDTIEELALGFSETVGEIAENGLGSLLGLNFGG